MAPIDPGPSAWDLPDPRRAAKGIDLVAVGAEVDAPTMLAGYRRGLFAMELSERVPGWFSPDPRGILPPTGFRVSRSMRRSLRRFTATVDREFDAVLSACADPRRPGHWITPTFVRAYRRLHELGWAHSVEVWHGPRLVGGLFGVELGGLFCGESMYHAEADASKVALAALASELAGAGGDRLLDVQWWTPHLGSLGAVSVPREVYLGRLGDALRLPPAMGRS